MADANKERFDKRVTALKRQANPAQRTVKRMREDGLVVIESASSLSQKRRLIPIKGVLIAIALFIALKGFLFAELGEAEYMERVDGLKKGGAIEVSAAFLLDADPATRALAGILKKTLQ